MNDWKKIGKALLFPHLAIIVLLVIASVIMLPCAFLVWDEGIITYVSYAVSAYTLTVVCFGIPNIIKTFKRIKKENKYVVRLSEDVRLRTNMMLVGSFVWDAIYAVFQLWLGFYHQSTWYFSLAVYYLLLAMMRSLLFMHLRKKTHGEELIAEYKRYRFCGLMLVLMNLALMIIVIYIIWQIRIFEHHEITTIAMAAYTFTTLTMAIVNTVRYRKYNSPAFSASKVISLAAALVSMLTLENAMLTVFDTGETGEHFHRLMTGLTGGAVILTILAMGVYMILKANKNIEDLKKEVGEDNGK